MREHCRAILGEHLADKHVAERESAHAGLGRVVALEIGWLQQANSECRAAHAFGNLTTGSVPATSASKVGTISAGISMIAE